MIDYYEPNIELTLLGCGFLGTYHLGAICLLVQIWPQKAFNRICGSSSGGLLAALIVSGCPLEQVFDSFMQIVRSLQDNFRTNPCRMRPLKDLVEESLDRMLPENAHKLCSNKLGLSLTRIWSFENKFVTEFDSRQDLIDAISAGCFIPFWSGSLVAPKFRGESCIDGAYSNNKPLFDTTRTGETFDEVSQISLSPFSGQVDVSPKEESKFMIKVMSVPHHATWKNIIRSLHALFPVSMEYYKFYLLEGYRDMKNYLFEHNLIRCRRCHLLSRQPVDRIYPKIEKTEISKCLPCLLLLEKVDNLRISEELIDLSL